ncbi:hypothetical protein BB558_006446 [Smittium angustum]|uniref:non-specific serine/threonine protein kinase n=1 Tax=Smittium angustum TaxID=133377 RepID=A0A2U1IXS6_SMIAN|nr:hypothetical protein BB558_006446 [Smittium angustum]
MADQKMKPTIAIGDYLIGNEIGKGSFAKVYKGFNKNTNTIVAVKSVARIKLTKKLLENLEQEINILKASQHLNVVELIDCLKSKNHIHLVMEYCSLGDLSFYIKQRKIYTPMQNDFGGLYDNIVLNLVSQLGSALLYLRKKNNLLLCPPNPSYVMGHSESEGVCPILKIADFGFARSLMTSSLADTLCGSPLYMAPEILGYERYDASADLWSVGAVTYEMCTGKPPFRASNHVELQRKIERANDIIIFPDEVEGNMIRTGGRGINSILKDLVRRLLKRNPEKRISFDDYFSHPALGDILNNQKTDIETEVSRIEKKNNISEFYETTKQNQPSVAESPKIKEMSSKVSESIPINAFKNLNLGKNDNINFTGDGKPSSVPKPQQKNLLSPKITETEHIHTQNIKKNKEMGLDGSKGQAIDKSSTYEDLGYVDISQKTETSSNNHISTQVSEWVRTSNINQSVHAFAEKEYVVVEKRAVEVNVLADELDSTPHSQDQAKIISNNHGVRPQVLQQLNMLSNSINNAVVSNSSNQNNNDSLHQNETKNEGKKPEEKQKWNRGEPAGSFSFLDSNLHNMFSGRPEYPGEDAAIKQMESLAYKAHAVAWLADMKVSNLQTFDENSKEKVIGEEQYDSKQELLLLLMGTSVDISNADAFSLYLKSLSLLHKAVVCARAYWNKNGNEMEKVGSKSSDTNLKSPNTRPKGTQPSYNLLENKGSASSFPRKSGVAGNFQNTHDISDKVASTAFNNAVQWVRNKFNDCLEKADLLKSISSSKKIDFTQVSVEKILYEKALELSRAAAIKELSWETPLECERAYQLSIWMLSAILEPTAQDPEVSGEDRQIVESFISVVVKRLDSLRDRLMTVSKAM